MNKILELYCSKNFIISIESDFKIDELYSCDDITIKLNNNKIYILECDCLRYSLLGLRSMLCEAFENKLQLHESINQDIGILWNKEFQNKTELIYEECEGQEFWVGRVFLLWSTPGDIKPSLTTWLYNDKDRNIIFEVTPTYYWNFIDPLSDEQDYITYEEFIKNYKPLLIEKISKEAAKEWILKIDELLKIIQSNEKKFLSEHRRV
jgi:hypothetical protein